MLAKLSRPKLHNVLVRPRLFALLDQGQTRAVTWVAGPPGAGKTALVASYLETKKTKEVWYHLDFIELLLEIERDFRMTFGADFNENESYKLSRIYGYIIAKSPTGCA